MKASRLLVAGAMFVGVTAMAGCARKVEVASNPDAPRQGINSLTAAERAAGWRLLFDGATTNGWRGYKMDRVPSEWMVMDGTLMKEKGTEDIITEAEYGDFELALDWKIGKGGNAGIFYRGNEAYDHIYWTAPEYQLLDDPNAPDGKNRLTSAAAAYGLYAAPAGVVHAADEWNQTRIVVKGAHVEHWLNGQKVVEYELWSPDWEAKVKASKFNEWPQYGRLKRGHIAIQGDHNGTLALRNIRIRELK